MISTLAFFAYILVWFPQTRLYFLVLVVVLLWLDPVAFWVVVIAVSGTILIEKYLLKKGDS